MVLVDVANGLGGDWSEEMTHTDCARLFFNESHHVTKERFFRVCCRTWMEDFFIDRADDANKITYEFLWNTLQQIYVSSSNKDDNTTIMSWVLPDAALFKDTKDIISGDDEQYKACLMTFWKELFEASEEESSISQSFANDKEAKRPRKRRRLGHSRFGPLEFMNLVKGRYKLPAVYLMISLFKETGIATNWLKLSELAHELPSIFKTFSENDILAGLALVGLASIGSGKLLEGLSPDVLLLEYYSGIDSHGPSILCILHDATALNLYNLRALICRQVLDCLKVHQEWSEDYKSLIIDACAVCISQEHPERFIYDIDSTQQQDVSRKRRPRRNVMNTKESIPDRFASPGFPLLVHIQLCLLRHEVERAAEITRKMDSSPCLDAELKDEAWFNIWTYLLEEGILFLDGNLDSPRYTQKRDFLYNYMACQVSQQAKNAMIDFYQEIANRICEQEDSSLEEKQYVLLACQQTVLRLLLKIRGLGLNTIIEFVEETRWPVEIPGQNSETDLNVWSANFLLRKRDVPSSLVDETTGLLDLSTRFKMSSEKQAEFDLDISLSATKNQSGSGPTQSSIEANSCHQLEPSSRGDLSKALSSREESDIFQQHHTSVESDPSEPDQRNEFDEDDGDNHEDIVDIENEDSNEVIEIDEEDNDDEEEICDSDDDHSSIHENSKYSDEDEEITNDVDGIAYFDEENTGSDDGCESSRDEEVALVFNVDEGETSSAQQKHIESDDDIDDVHGRSEDELCSTVEDGSTGIRKHGSDESNADEESDCLEVDAEDVDHDISVDQKSDGLDDRELSAPSKTSNIEGKNVLPNDHDDTEADHIHFQKAHNFRTGVAAVGGEFGDTTEEDDGNDRFKANSTAQADRLADALRSGVGYASQVEDGYEPEDTHGYTEEEVSEAIHTEDEEDENMAKQKSTLSDTDTSQQQLRHTSHTDEKEILVSGQPQDTVAKPDRQNSIEPTSDDMDMADEHTEEDVGAEFSELEENPDCSFESQKPQPESTQAKTLLEFAQKAQSKENWIGLAKEKESVSEDVDSSKNDAQNAIHGLLGQKPELSKNCASSFDADDEKYATEGCKSLETEEDDTEKDCVEILSREGSPVLDDTFVDKVHDKQGKHLQAEENEIAVGSHGSTESNSQGKKLDKDYDSVGHEHDNIDNSIREEENAENGDEEVSGAVSRPNTPKDEKTLIDGEMVLEEYEGHSEVEGIIVGHTEEVKAKEQSTQKDDEQGGNTGDHSIDEEVTAESAEPNMLPDGHKEDSTAAVFDKVESQMENDIKEINNSDLDMVQKRRAPEYMDDGKNGDHFLSGDNGETLDDQTAKNTEDMKIHDGGGKVESDSQGFEGSISLEASCAEEQQASTDDGAYSMDIQPHLDVPDGAMHDPSSIEKKAGEEAISGPSREMENGIELVKDDCDDSNHGSKVESVTAGDENIGLQETGVKSSVEDTDSQLRNDSCDGKAEEVDVKTGVDEEVVEIGMKQTTQDDPVDSSNGELYDKESVPLNDQPLGEVDESESTKEVTKDTEPFPSDEIPGVNDAVEDEPSDIPQFIGGDFEEQSSEQNSRSERLTDTVRRSDEEEGSIGDESEDKAENASVVSGASAISEIFRTHAPESSERHEDDQPAVSSKFSSRSQKQTSNKRKPSTRASTRASSRSASENSGDKNSLMTRGGLPPRPPKGTNNEPARRTTRSKRKIDDDTKPTRSTRSSKRMASRQLNPKDVGVDDDASVQTMTSTRSTRSSTRKLSAGTRASKQKAKDNEDDDASVQTITSTRSTRSSTRKLSAGTRASKQKAKDNEDDDASVQTITSTRSTRSSTRNQASRAKKVAETGSSANEKADASWTVKQLREELQKRGIQVPSKARKKELLETLISSDEK